MHVRNFSRRLGAFGQGIETTDRSAVKQNRNRGGGVWTAIARATG
jgi:hypothetical protein